MDAHQPANADDARRSAELHARTAHEPGRTANEPGRKANDFRVLWDDHHARVRSYVVRRVGSDEADDVVAAVFETAWRRWSSLPFGAERLWWLLSCARKTCANHRRSLTRRSNLTERVRGQVGRGVAGSGDTDFAEQVVSDATVRQALAGLSPDDREALLLSVWDDLDPAGVAAVLGIGRPAAQKRVARARERFEKRYVELSAEPASRTLNGEETP